MCKPTKFYCILIILLNMLNIGLTAKPQQTTRNNKNVDHTDIGKQVIIIKHIGNCDESKNYSFNMQSYKTVQVRKNVYVMSGVIEIRDSFTGRKMKATLDIRKCDVSFQTENCQPFVFWPIDDLCDFFNSDKSVYGVFFKNYPERPKCPLKQKPYYLTNVPINMEIVSVLPTFGVQNYIVNLRFYADKSLVGCFTHHLSIRTKRA